MKMLIRARRLRLLLYAKGDEPYKKFKHNDMISDMKGEQILCQSNAKKF